MGINGTLITFLVPPVAKGGYGFDTTDVGIMYLAPIIAIIAGELFGNLVRSPRIRCRGQGSDERVPR